MKNKQPVPLLIPFLILVSMLFIGILIFAYVETRKANPKMIEVGEAIDFGRLWPHTGTTGSKNRGHGRPSGRPAS